MEGARVALWSYLTAE